MQKIFSLRSTKLPLKLCTLHNNTSSIKEPKEVASARKAKSHRCPTERTQNQPYLYQINYFPGNKNLHAIRHISWQDYVKSGKGKTISLILGCLLRPMAIVFNKEAV
jgi:hypothetical protein